MKIITFNTSMPEYLKALQLRTDVLRTPLGLKFTAAELAKDIPDIHFGLFQANGEVLACLSLTAAENGKVKMRQVAVRHDMQGKGLGKQLVAASEEYAKEQGYTKMFCHARKVAVPFYTSMGYSIVSEEFTEVNIPHYAMEKQL